ncbi:hypothetical protein CYLTODRAFT_420264 [Cylindrobasidium torrendii FP15055 ss-10]|uniref:F-box domain-containing protein n=1 Tax=Cylindrobasidium torrendii FP15055 ss-10 TaxID=1314674 RepID=A0A0D7BK19_9AGAR|nr:hypothetical protein CYLTODRAFT_420264 [Cylindrobasidium torrendii FP15055 ss-10]
MLSITDLPPELLVSVFAFLQLPDLSCTRCVCKQFAQVISTSLILRYQMSLERYGMKHNPHSEMDTAQSLDALERHLDAWTPSILEPSFVKIVDISNKDSGIYELSGGTYFLGRTAGQTVPFLRLPSSPEDPVQWDELHVQGDIVDIGIAVYEHDLFVAVVMDPAPNLFLRFYSLSAKGPHPSAKRHSLFVQNQPVGRISVCLEIVGPHLILVTRDIFPPGDSSTPDSTYVFNWMEGRRIKTIRHPNQTYSGLVFLTPTLVVFPDLKSFALDIWRIDDDSCVPLVTLNLPLLNSGFSIQHMACRSCPNPGSFSKNAAKRPFQYDPEEAIIIFHVHLASLGPSIPFAFFVHKRTLVDLIPEPSSSFTTTEEEEGAPTVIPWSTWSPGKTRWIFQNTLDLITTTAGQRYVYLQKQHPAVACVLDFNMRGRAAGRSVLRSDTNDNGKEGGTPFDEALEGTLPCYVSCVEMACVEGMVDAENGNGNAAQRLETVIMDEERILGFKLDDSYRLKDLVIWYFG